MNTWRNMWVDDEPVREISLEELGHAPVDPVRVRVYCDGPAPFHDRKGRTYLETFERQDDGWHPVMVVSARAREATRGTRRTPRPRQTNVQYLKGDRPMPFVAGMRTHVDGLRVKVAFECGRCHARHRMTWERFALVLDAVAVRGGDAVSLRDLQIAGS